MGIKNKHVAVAYDEKGICEFVAKVKVIDDRELNRLTNEKEQSKAQRQNKEKELNNKVARNEENIRLLKSLSLNVQAKSIYDNFVDRGLIENDDDFQQMWYDYYFNNGNLNLKNAPQEYKNILERLNSYEQEN